MLYVVVYRHKRGYTKRVTTKYPVATMLLLSALGKEVLYFKSYYMA
jgi:hypothetical protein